MIINFIQKMAPRQSSKHYLDFSVFHSTHFLALPQKTEQELQKPLLS